MASPSFTYTLANSTTADADQVMQNFNDILNGVTDGTKDLSIAAFTAAGTATFNGNVTLGNATADDITVTGSLASSIPIKTDATYDIGTTSLGLRKAYFGGNSQRVSIGASASTSASWALTLPVTAGADGEVFTTNGSGVATWGRVKGLASGVTVATSYLGEKITGSTVGGTLTTATAANAATIDLTAGVWMVYFKANLSEGAAGNITALELSISATTGTLDTATTTREWAQASDAYALSQPVYLNISGAATYYGVVKATFASSTVTRTSNTILYAVRIG